MCGSADVASGLGLELGLGLGSGIGLGLVIRVRGETNELWLNYSVTIATSADTHIR